VRSGKIKREKIEYIIIVEVSWRKKRQRTNAGDVCDTRSNLLKKSFACSSIIREAKAATLEPCIKICEKTSIKT
jgi:hypothetical protein